MYRKDLLDDGEVTKMVHLVCRIWLFMYPNKTVNTCIEYQVHGNSQNNQEHRTKQNS